MRGAGDDVERVRDIFQEAFLGVWRGELEDDGLNGLVLAAGLTGREVTVLRAIAQVPAPGRDRLLGPYIERTLLAPRPRSPQLLVELFAARFDPEQPRRGRAAERIEREIEAAIDAVESLDEDRILRSFLLGRPARSCARTTSAPTRSAGAPASSAARAFLSFKLDPSLIPLLPLPRPRFEIFVYSPRIEGVHLRGGKVARGGLRWSDRREDFRTEVLGLMKAQMVKNALIVPVGSKGGFVVKRPPPEGGREALQAEVDRLLQDVPVAACST